MFVSIEFCFSFALIKSKNNSDLGIFDFGNKNNGDLVIYVRTYIVKKQRFCIYFGSKSNSNFGFYFGIQNNRDLGI